MVNKVLFKQPRNSQEKKIRNDKAFDLCRFRFLVKEKKTYENLY